MKIIVVGAGFSGLVSAYYLKKAGHEVTVVEKNSQPGGLISTIHHPLGLVETAANGVMSSAYFEEIAAEIGVPLSGSRQESKRRYIFRDKPQRWPLGLFETLWMILKFIFAQKAPRPLETVEHWGHRVLGTTATRYLLAPALQGIYAGDIAKLSATLILGRFFSGKRTRPPRPHIAGTVSPVEGMGAFIGGLKSWLEKQGVHFEFKSEVTAQSLRRADSECPIVFAGSLGTVADFIEGIDHQTAAKIRGLPMLPAISFQAFFDPTPKDVHGFGVLFPRDQAFRPLGVLFNNEIFENRGSKRSERWILGGALDPEVLKLDDATLLGMVLDNRSRLMGGPSPRPLAFHVQRWPVAFPHYTTELETFIGAGGFVKLEAQGIYCVGNYTGSLGLSRILEQLHTLPSRFK